MRIFAIRDESAAIQKNLAYLLYYELEKRFYIELPEDADSWELPLLLDSFVKKGETTVNSYWSEMWVRQRIIPPDRQNIGEILRDNNLDSYDEYNLLMLAMGRCAQDDYYLVPLCDQDLPAEISARFAKRIEDVLPLPGYCLLTFFRDGVVKKCSLHDYFTSHPSFSILLNRPDFFNQVRLLTGGHGVSWDVDLTISDTELYHIGAIVPLTSDDFRSFAAQRVVNVAESAEILGCTRQNIEYLTKHGKLHPIKASGKNTLYLKSEILKRNWQ